MIAKRLPAVMPAVMHAGCVVGASPQRRSAAENDGAAEDAASHGQPTVVVGGLDDGQPGMNILAEIGASVVVVDAAPKGLEHQHRELLPRRLRARDQVRRLRLSGAAERHLASSGVCDAVVGVVDACGKHASTVVVRRLLSLKELSS